MDNTKIIFFNIGWMGRYQGHTGQADRIVGGGEYVAENGTGNEVCNFVEADDGNVYGHVETIKGAKDRKIQQIDLLGGKNENHVDGVTVIWTATDPEDGRGHVVGWYENATVHRARMMHDGFASKQHKRDKIESYITVARAKDSYCLPIEARTLKLPQSVHPGQVAWRAFAANPNDEQSEALESLRAVMSDTSFRHGDRSQPGNGKVGTNSGAASSSYQRYVQSYEVTINPEHSLLQAAFRNYISKRASNVQEDIEYVDLRYRDKKDRLVLVEVKPCTEHTSRYAIRTAIGQLLDYEQRNVERSRLLIVIQEKPTKEDRKLAQKNGFGVAYPNSSGGFAIKWP